MPFKTTAYLGCVLILAVAGGLLQRSFSVATAQTKSEAPSQIACSDNTTLLPDQRTPQTCADSDFARYGRPVMFALHDGIAYGVSVAPDKSTAVTIWMDNQTEKQQIAYICCNATFVRYIDLYDESGQRIPSRLEIANMKGGPLQGSDPRAVAGCGCSMSVTVHPHSLKVIDHGDLSLSYTLLPGRYTIVEYVSLPGKISTVAPSLSLPTARPRLNVSVP